jgi:hypothetical protein
MHRQSRYRQQQQPHKQYQQKQQHQKQTQQQQQHQKDKKKNKYEVAFSSFSVHIWPKWQNSECKKHFLFIFRGMKRTCGDSKNNSEIHKCGTNFHNVDGKKNIQITRARRRYFSFLFIYLFCFFIVFFNFKCFMFMFMYHVSIYLLLFFTGTYAPTKE